MDSRLLHCSPSVSSGAYCLDEGLFHKAIRTDRKRRILEKPEEFEDDHYNDNHSNDVKDVSVHAGDSYQIARSIVNIYPNLPDNPAKFAQRIERS
jgi:hypothetical protein